MHKNIVQNTSEWLDFRKDKIGASDASIIMGVNPWKTPYQLWLQKLGISENKSTPTMKWGLEKEDDSRKRFYNLTNIAVIPNVKVHSKYEWMMASLDGLSCDEETCVEIKNHRSPSDFNHVVETKTVPEKYYPQLQQQLEVLDLPSMYYMCFYDGDHCLIEVERDQDYIDDMIPKLKEFHECIINQTPPPLTDKDKKHRSDENWLKLANEWLNISEQLSILKEKESFIREQLITESGEHSSEGAGIYVTRSIRKGNIDYSKVEELQNIDMEKYRKPTTETWSIRKQKIS